MTDQNNNYPYTPYESFYVECGEGWKDIYEPIMRMVYDYNSNHDDKIEITQIKEKFGGIRIYLDKYTNELSDAIRKAEIESYNTCELCGSKENVGTTIDYWYTTLCLDCLQKSIEKGCYEYRIWERQSDKKMFKVTKDNIEEIEDYETYKKYK